MKFTLNYGSVIEVKFSISLLNNFLVSLLEIFGQDNVSVLSDSLHASFLADRLYVCAADFLRTGNEVFKVNFFAQVHFARERLEYKSLLSAIWKRKFDLSIESSRSEECWIEGVSTIGGHNTLYVNSLVETIHLLQELNKNSLDFAIGSCIRIKSFCGNGIDFIDEDNRWCILLGHPEDVPHHSWAFT